MIEQIQQEVGNLEKVDKEIKYELWCNFYRGKVKGVKDEICSILEYHGNPSFLLPPPHLINYPISFPNLPKTPTISTLFPTL